MELSYYFFAFFIFLLLCSFALLCRILFLRGRRERQNYDEKEKKLLTLYSTMEDMMDEFNQTALKASEEMNRHITEIRSIKVSARPTPPYVVRQPSPPPPPPPTPPMSSLAAGEMRINAPPSPHDYAAQPATEAAPKGERLPDRILSLHEEGLDRLHIAERLAVTMGEVDLVLGIAKQKPETKKRLEVRG